MTIKDPKRLGALALVATLALGACSSSGATTTPSNAAASEPAASEPAASEPAASEPTGGNLSATLLGAGATFPDPVYQEWIGMFTKDVEPGVAITYEPIGSGGGVEQFIGQSTDFGGSDAFMKDDEIAAAEQARGCKVLHIPTVFGAVAVAYNLSGVDGLVLDSDTLAKIFLGTHHEVERSGHRRTQQRPVPARHGRHRRPPLGWFRDHLDLHHVPRPRERRLERRRGQGQGSHLADRCRRPGQ